MFQTTHQCEGQIIQREVPLRGACCPMCGLWLHVYGETGDFERQHKYDVKKGGVKSSSLAEHASGTHTNDLGKARVLARKKGLSRHHYLESLLIQTTPRTLNRNDGNRPSVYARCLRDIFKRISSEPLGHIFSFYFEHASCVGAKLFFCVCVLNIFTLVGTVPRVFLFSELYSIQQFISHLSLLAWLALLIHFTTKSTTQKIK